MTEEGHERDALFDHHLHGIRTGHGDHLRVVLHEVGHVAHEEGVLGDRLHGRKRAAELVPFRLRGPAAEMQDALHPFLGCGVALVFLHLLAVGLDLCFGVGRQPANGDRHQVRVGVVEPERETDVAGRIAERRNAAKATAGGVGQGAVALVAAVEPRGLDAFPDEEERTWARGPGIEQLLAPAAYAERVAFDPAGVLVVELLHIGHHAIVVVGQAAFAVVRVHQGAVHQRGMRHDQHGRVGHHGAVVGEIAGGGHRGDRGQVHDAGLTEDVGVRRIVRGVRGQQHLPRGAAERGQHAAHGIAVQHVHQRLGPGVHEIHPDGRITGLVRQPHVEFGGAYHVVVAAIAHLDPRERLAIGIVRGQARIGVVQVVDHIAAEGRARTVDRVARNVEGVPVQLVAFEDRVEHRIEGTAVRGVEPEVVVAATAVAGVVHTRPHHVHLRLGGIGAQERHGRVDRLGLAGRARCAGDGGRIEPSFAFHHVGIGRLDVGAIALLVTAHEELQALAPEPGPGVVQAEGGVGVVRDPQLLLHAVPGEEIADRVVVQTVVGIVLVRGVVPHVQVFPAVVLAPAEFDEVARVEHAIRFALHIDGHLLFAVEQLDLARIHGGHREARVGQGRRIDAVDAFRSDLEAPVLLPVMDPLVAVRLGQGPGRTGQEQDGQ